MWVVKYRTVSYVISAIIVIASIASLFIWGLLPGIDFTGGTLVQVSYEKELPKIETVTQAISKIDPSVSVRPGVAKDGTPEYIVRMRSVDMAEKDVVLAALSPQGSASSTLKSFDSVGPVLGAEAMRKAYWSIVLVILAIVAYITFAFRKVSAPVSSWKYGLIAVVALAHDVIIPTGVFAILGKYAGYEVNTLFVTAILVVLGFSVHNTIVVFDRVRENLRVSGKGESFEAIVGKSVSQTLTRSLNTSLTTLIALIVLYFLAGAATQSFILALIIGIAVGTWSSLVIAPPLLVTFDKLKNKK